MGLHLTVEVDQRIVICTFSGEVDDADILSLRSLLAAHPDFDPGLSEILDFSGVTAANLSINALQFVSMRDSILSPTSMHIVVARRDFIFGLGRMMQAYAQDTRPNAAVVRTMQEARELLATRNIRPTE